MPVVYRAFSCTNPLSEAGQTEDQHVRIRSATHARENKLSGSADSKSQTNGIRLRVLVRQNGHGPAALVHSDIRAHANLFFLIDIFDGGQMSLKGESSSNVPNNRVKRVL